MYSNKWVKTSSDRKTTITIEANFGTYYTKEDAIKRKNPIDGIALPEIAIYLEDSEYNRTSTQYVTADRTTQKISFTVTGDKPYYIVLNFCSGRYHSGWFTVTEE